MGSFGLSVSLLMAIITRFFVGLTNGMSAQISINMANENFLGYLCIVNLDGMINTQLQVRNFNL